jgi:hypothetical protein
MAGAERSLAAERRFFFDGGPQATGADHCSSSGFRRAPRDVLASFSLVRYRLAMPDSDKLKPVEPRDLADAIAFALRFEGRKRVHHADEYMAAIAAERVVRHLERAGFVVLKRPPAVGGALLGRGKGYTDRQT